ncbi:MAG: PEP-CTERM sorting domain-containing protein [Akkermansia sp.]
MNVNRHAAAGAGAPEEAEKETRDKMQNKTTAIIREGALLLCAATAICPAYGAGEAEKQSVVLQVQEKLRSEYDGSYENLRLVPLPSRIGDPQQIRRYLLQADDADDCILLVMVDPQSDKVLALQVEKPSTTEEQVRDRYASVLRNARTGHTLVLHRGMTQEQNHALEDAEFVPHVGVAGGSLTPWGPLFGPVWFLSAGASKSYVRPMTTLPSTSAPAASTNPPLHMLGGARPGQPEEEPALQPTEDEEPQEAASESAAATSASSPAAGGAFGSSGVGAGSARAFSTRMSLRMLGNASAPVSEVSAPAWQYSWDFDNKCAIYSSDGGSTWNKMDWGSWTELSHDVFNRWDSTLTDATKVTISENTTFKATYNPNKIIGEGEHINVAIMGSTLDEHYNPRETILENIDTLYIGSTTTDDGSNGWRIRLGISDFIKDSSKVIYNDGGQLWLFSHASDASGRGIVEVGATIYTGGSKYDDRKEAYAKHGLAADLRLEGFVNLKNTIHLTDHARFIALKDTNLSTNGAVHFLEGSSILGHDNDLELGAIDTTVRASIPYYFDKGSEITGVRGLVLGGEQLGDGSKYGTVNVYMSGKLDAGSLSVGNGSTMHVTEDAGALRFHNVGPGSKGEYHYSLLLEDNGTSKALVNMGDKASISCAGEGFKATASDLPVGVISGELAMQVQGETVTISGGKTAAATAAGSKDAAWKGASGERSTLRNLAVDLKSGASLELNDMVLSEYHALRGADANEVLFNNVVVDLTSEYTMSPQPLEQKPADLYATGSIMGGGKTLTVLDTDKVLVLNYTGMSNLSFTEGGTLLLDFEGLDLSGYNYVAVDFANSVFINPEKVTITGNTGHSDPAGYFVAGDSNSVYFHLAPEPTTGALCLIALVALAARRRRKQIGRSE